jgi:hypothetical protein
LPEARYHEVAAQADWVLFELEPPARASPERLGDVVVFSTCVPEAMRSFLEGARFSSRRFSRYEERFLYVVAHVPGLSPEAKLGERTRLERAVEHALVPGGLGAVVGAGIGLDHVYLVVTLAALEGGLESLRQALTDVTLLGPAWLLNCDTARSREWLGVGTVLPPPFLR